MNYSHELSAEVNRQLALALFPKGCGIAPISFEITGLGAKMDEIPRVTVEGHLEPGAMERLAKVLKAGQEALKPVDTTAPAVPDAGFPLSTIPETDFHKPNKQVWLLMGGQWVKGGINRCITGHYSSEYSDIRTVQWDLVNQPTAWKPL